MKKEIYNLEGIEIEVEKYDKNDKDAERRRLAYCFRMIREKSGMSRTDFSVWLGVPYRTMQEWELGRRAMPEYVLRLIAYKVMNELREGRIVLYVCFKKNPEAFAVAGCFCFVLYEVGIGNFSEADRMGSGVAYLDSWGSYYL